MKNKLTALAFISLLALTACGTKKYQPQDYILSMNYKDDFRILQLTDIHLSDKDDQQTQFKFMDLNVQLCGPTVPGWLILALSSNFIKSWTGKIVIRLVIFHISLDKEHKTILRKEYKGTKDLYGSLFKDIWNMTSLITIFPVQDLIKLDDKARINHPGTVGPHNWTFKFKNMNFLETVKYGN